MADVLPKSTEEELKMRRGKELYLRLRHEVISDTGSTTFEVKESEHRRSVFANLNYTLSNIDKSVNSGLVEAEVKRFEAVPRSKIYDVTYTSVIANKSMHGCLHFAMKKLSWNKRYSNYSSSTYRANFFPREAISDDLTYDDVDSFVMFLGSIRLFGDVPGYNVFKVCTFDDEQNEEETPLMSELPVENRKGPTRPSLREPTPTMLQKIRQDSSIWKCVCIGIAIGVYFVLPSEV